MKNIFTKTLFLIVLFISIDVFSQKNDDRYRLIIKFLPEYVADVENGVLFFAPEKKKSSVDRSLLNTYRYKQVMNFSREEKQQMRQGVSMKPRGRNSFNIYKYRGLVYLIGSEEKSLNELKRIAEEFEKSESVEYTDLESVIPPPPPVTPDFTDLQTYRKADIGDDVIGIHMEYAWGLGVKGQGIKIADIEWGFDYDHEDLQRPNFIELLATSNHDFDNHGTAVAGVMYAIENGFGMTGMVDKADAFYGISEKPQGRAAGIALGIEQLNKGDIFVYEMQLSGQNGEYVPADFSKTVWDITKQATDAGIIVVAAAGNGNENLDDPFYDEYNSRGDNGAIIVGAGTKKGRNKTSFSTYGSRVNLQGWGDWSVATTGYGTLYNGGPQATYTKSFSGTSSATPIVASAVVAVQSYAKNVLGFVLTPHEMRSLLIETGTSQGTGWTTNVPQPNIQAAIVSLSLSNCPDNLIFKNQTITPGSYKAKDKITLTSSVFTKGTIRFTAGQSVLISNLSMNAGSQILISAKPDPCVDAISEDGSNSNTASETPAVAISLTEDIEPTIVKNSMNIYPNPFSNELFIAYESDQEVEVKLFLYDRNGAQVAEVNVSERQQPGKHVMRFDGFKLPSGMYFYKLKIGERMEGGRIMKLN